MDNEGFPVPARREAPRKEPEETVEEAEVTVEEGTSRRYEQTGPHIIDADYEEVPDNESGEVNPDEGEDDDGEMWSIREEGEREHAPAETEVEHGSRGTGGDEGGGGESGGTNGGGASSTPPAETTHAPHGHGGSGMWGVFVGIFGAFLALSWYAIKGAAKMAGQSWGGGGSHKSHGGDHEKHDDHGGGHGHGGH